MGDIGIVYYPPSVIGNKNDYLVAYQYDESFDGFINYKYRNYILYNRSVVTTLTVEANGVTGLFATKLTGQGLGDTFIAGQIVYLLAEPVTTGTTVSDVYNVLNVIDSDNIIIDRNSDYNTTNVFTYSVSNTISLVKAPDYKTGIGNFILTNDLFDINLNSFTNYTQDSELMEVVENVSTYSSQNLTSSVPEANGIKYNITSTGNDYPYITLELTQTQFNAYNFEVGDSITLEMDRQFNDPNVGLGYETIIENGVTKYYLTYESTDLNFITTNLVYVGNSVRLNGPSVFDLKSFVDKDYIVKSLTATKLVFTYAMTDFEKETLDIVLPNAKKNGMRLLYDGLTRNGTFVIMNTSYDVEGFIQINANGLGKPSSQTSYPNGVTYVPFSSAVNVSLLKNVGDTVNTLDVVLRDPINIINARKGYVEYNNDETYDDYIVSNSGINTKNLFNSNLDLSFNELSFGNYIVKPSDNVPGKFSAGVTYLRMYYNDSNGEPAGSFLLKALNTLDVNAFNYNTMYTIGFGPQQLIDAGVYYQGFTLLDITSFEDVYKYEIELYDELFAGVQISKTVTVNIIEGKCSNYTKQRLIYRNKLGSFVGLNFELANEKTLSKDNSDYTRNNINATTDGIKYDNIRGGYNITNSKIIEKHKLQGDWISESQVADYEELFMSTEVFLQTDDDTNLENLIAVHITDTSFVEKTSAKDVLIRYTINIELNNHINIK